MALTDIACRTAKPAESTKKLSDGGGLRLLVQPSGSKLWQMAYRFEGKQKTLSFGSYPEVSLATARAMRDDAKRTLSGGFDPGSKKVANRPVDSFEVAARRWFEAQQSAWVPAHAARVLSRFEKDVFPEIGAMHIGQIEATDVLKVLRKIEARGALDVNKRIRQSISAVFRYAIANGWCKRDPAADVRDALPTPPKAKHMATISLGELPAFFKKLADYDGQQQTALAIEFVMHTFVRTSELVFARWSEFDGSTWRIPGERMKMGRDHIVPLTSQATAILAELKALAGKSEWVVPGDRPGKPISTNTMIFALYRMGYHSRATMHGFRGLASTTLNESLLFSPDAIERQLAHVPKNKVRGAYNAAEYLPERIRLMQWWSDLLEAKKAEAPARYDLSDLLN